MSRAKRKRDSNPRDDPPRVYMGSMVLNAEFGEPEYECKEHNFIGDAPGCVACLQDRISVLDTTIKRLEKDKAEMADVQAYWVSRCKTSEMRVRELMGGGTEKKEGKS